MGALESQQASGELYMDMTARLKPVIRKRTHHDHAHRKQDLVFKILA